AAHSRKDLAKLRAFREGLSPQDREKYEILDETQIHSVLKTDIYRGAMVRHDQGTIHPAKYVRALANRARALGVRIFTGWRYAGARKNAEGYVASLDNVESKTTVEIRSEKIL